MISGFRLFNPDIELAILLDDVDDRSTITDRELRRQRAAGEGEVANGNSGEGRTGQVRADGDAAIEGVGEDAENCLKQQERAGGGPPLRLARDGDGYDLIVPVASSSPQSSPNG